MAFTRKPEKRKKSKAFQSDIAHRKRVETALRESEANFRELFDEAPVGYHEIDLEGRITRVNRTELALLGYTADEMLGRHVWEFVHEKDISREAVAAKIAETLPLKSFERTLIKKDGSLIPVLLQERHLRSADGRVIGIRTTIQDITERKRMEEQLLHEAFHDGLTGLSNRAFFTNALGRLVERMKRRKDYLFAVLYLDLDRFKTINDSLGHMMGDQLLIAFARRMQLSLRPEDTVARFGGDEFAILLHDINDVTDAMRVAERIHKALTLPFNLSGEDVFTAASIGIALSTTGYDRPEDLLRDADTAMYRAKAQGGACHRVFDTVMHVRAVTVLQLETDLRRAVERQEFRVHYQPIVSLESGKIAGFEALVRWQHPDRGLLFPETFIPVAEEIGLIIPLGRWVLREACRQMREWQERFPTKPSLYINVNLSVKQLMQFNLIEQIDQTLQGTGLDAQSLRLEITESAIMEHAEAAIATLSRLRARGIQLYIDDFGAGYSSLSQLNRIPIDTFKIDRSFVSQMGADGQNTEIIRTIVNLARNLGKGVIAEGVETSEQRAQLGALDCKQMQGYFFSRPLDAEAAGALIAEQETPGRPPKFL